MGSGVSVAVEAGVGRSEPALGVNDRCMRNAATGVPAGALGMPPAAAAALSLLSRARRAR